jgi:hypothetical protein
VTDEVGDDGIGDCVAAVSGVNLGLEHKQVAGGNIGTG